MMSGSGSGSGTNNDSNIIDLAGIVSSFLLKLTTSMDDLLWLSPFLTLSSSLLSSAGGDDYGLFSPSWYSKMKHSIIYFGICVCVTMVSFLFGNSLLLFLTRFDDNNEGSRISYWNIERFLPICSSIVLLCIARRDYVEWKEEQEHEQVVSNNNNNDNYKRSRSSLEMLIVKDDDDNNNKNNSQIYDDVEEGNVISTNNSVDDNNVNTRIKEDGLIEMQNFPTTTSCSLSSRQQLRSRSSIHSTTSTSSSSNTTSSSIKIGKEKKNDICSDYIDANADIDENKNNNNNGEDSDNELRAKIVDASKSLHRFVIVCIMGTLDDMIVFSTFVAGSTSTSSSSSAISTSGHENNNNNQNENNKDNKEQQFLSLLVGTILAASFILVLSWGFSEMKWFQQLIQKIPM